MIKVGDTLPNATLTESLEFGDACPLPPQKVSVAEAAAGKRIAILGLPGAFTSTCSMKHLPGYVQHAEQLRQKGIDEIWCVSVNDGFVMAAWGREQGALGKVRMLGDGSAELTQKLGLDVNIPGMGIRMQRCSMVVDNGVVTHLNVEQPLKFEVSSAEYMLGQL